MGINLDADQGNADWTKTTWDLPVDNATDFTMWLRAHNTTFAKFQQLPVYRHNVDKTPWLAAYAADYDMKALFDRWDTEKS